MKVFNFWQKWLVVVSSIVFLIGIGSIFVAAFPIELNAMTRVLFKEGYLPDNARLFYQVILGLCSSMMTPWALFILIIALIPFKRQEKWAWTATLACILTWYFIDCSFSSYGKMYFNVVFNTVMGSLMIAPFVFTWKYFFRQSSAKNS